MRSINKGFNEFLSWLESLRFFSIHEVEGLLAPLGGASGVVENSLYISAYEILGCALVEKFPSVIIKEFLVANEKQLGANSSQLYYFVESIVDQSVVRGVKSELLIEVAPADYKPFLSKRFASS
ncbi:hypothetical protein [Pseudomonas granadensis]|uniref:hypothetical protein n=1 Tax=Pseudomonas granadensis TaxID=1421430 RepID=UPI0012FE6C85|nr:hypothetical protein [Pseudomonas granadensis]